MKSPAVLGPLFSAELILPVRPRHQERSWGKVPSPTFRGRRIGRSLALPILRESQGLFKKFNFFNRLRSMVCKVPVGL